MVRHGRPILWHGVRRAWLTEPACNERTPRPTPCIYEPSVCSVSVDNHASPERGTYVTPGHRFVHFFKCIVGGTAEVTN